MHGVPTPLTLIGLGAVGLRLALRCKEAGLQVRGHARSAAARSRARAAGVAVEDELSEALSGARCVLLCVPAPALEEVAVALADALGPGANPVCLHSSGGVGIAPLARLGSRGCALGTLHPLAAFAPVGPGPDFTRMWCAIDGEAAARASALSLVASLGARPLLLAQSEDAALRYHAAASLLANGSVALASLALEQASAACQDPREARHAFLALLQSSVDNLSAQSCERALSGPIARGEVATVRAHLALLADEPQALEAYRALSRQMLLLAQRDGRLDAARARAIELELNAPRP